MSILVVLASVALPAYSNYQLRAQATEFTMSISPYKTLLSEWALLNPGISQWPANDNDLGWQEFSGDFVEQVQYRRAADSSIAAIVVSGQVGSNQLEVFYQGKLTETGVQWSCVARPDSLRYLPKTCISGVAAGL